MGLVQYDLLDVKDSVGKWEAATVVGLSETQVQAHYIDWSDQYDEWLPLDSDRVAAFRSHTNGNAEVGQLFCESYGQAFSTGDVIGCGFDWVTGEVYFTLNGVHQGVAFYNLPRMNLYPGVCISGYDGKIKANFGQEAFRYEWRALRADEQLLQQAWTRLGRLDRKTQRGSDKKTPEQMRSELSDDEVDSYLEVENLSDACSESDDDSDQHGSARTRRATGRPSRSVAENKNNGGSSDGNSVLDMQLRVRRRRAQEISVLGILPNASQGQLMSVLEMNGDSTDRAVAWAFENPADFASIGQHFLAQDLNGGAGGSFDPSLDNLSHNNHRLARDRRVMSSSSAVDQAFPTPDSGIFLSLYLSLSLS